MLNSTTSGTPPTLILADFADGSWHASSFALQFLHREKPHLSILQTYQSPNWGHFMMRKITPQLKEITKHELKKLKDKVLSNFNIEKRKVHTQSVEGELSIILQYKPIINGPHNIVLGTYSSFIDSCNMQNKCLEEIINTAANPMFVVPGEFTNGRNKKLLFVGNINKKPSEQLVQQVKDICKRTESNLEILFVLNKNVSEIPDEIRTFYSENFEEIELSINQVPNSTKCKGIKKFLKNESRDLIIIDSK
uniref:hypothetical protein n=1 Tax=uncultured Draconibacterium sp. TaxID=1573823 RepID=UPI003216F671